MFLCWGRRRDMNDNSLSKCNRETGQIIRDTLSCLAEGLTGIAASDRKELAFSVGHIFQSLRKGQFLSRLLSEWNAYRVKGRIPKDYHETEQHHTCLQELLEFLDHDSPDEIRFDTVKKIFLVAATETVSNRNSLLPYQYLRLCRRMSSGEMIVLNATYRIAKSGQIPTVQGAATQWLQAIAAESGLGHTALVEIYEQELMEKHLITARRYSDRSGVTERPNFRLTSLGLDLCQYIDSYDSPQPGS